MNPMHSKTLLLCIILLFSSAGSLFSQETAVKDNKDKRME